MTNRKRTGETLVELLMSVVAPIIGGIVTIVLLKQFTTLPGWLCLLIGLPVGTILGWIAMLTMIVVIGSLLKSKSK